MVDVPPSTFGGVTSEAKGNTPKPNWSFLSGPCLALCYRHIEVTNQDLITWPFLHHRVKQLLCEMDLPIPPVNVVDCHLPEGVQPKSDSDMSALSSLGGNMRHRVLDDGQMSAPSQNNPSRFPLLGCNSAAGGRGMKTCGLEL
jgi:hypothetical protein